MIPDAPGKPEVKDINATQMSVFWTSPKSDGGSPITGYIVEQKDAESTRWSRVTKELIMDTTYEATNLKADMEYQFRVMAENKAGTGPASEPSDKRGRPIVFFLCYVV